MFRKLRRKLRKAMKRSIVVEQVCHPCETLETQAAVLLNHVDGEFEDEDGDRATAFILADPLPAEHAALSPCRDTGHSHQFDGGGSSLLTKHCALSNSVRKRQLEDEDEASFVCQICKLHVSLQLLGPDLNCSCLCCQPCLQQHLESCLVLELKRISGACDTNLKVSVAEGKEEDAAALSRVAELLDCPSCKAPVSLAAVQLLAPEACKRWQEEANQVLFKTADFVSCPGCCVMIEKVIGNIPAGITPSGVPELDRTAPFIELDNDGKPMSRAALFHRATNFFRCVLCKVGFCGLCMTCPYHLGYTCQEYETFKNAVKCLYCEAPILSKEQVDNQSRSVSVSVKNLRRELDSLDVDASWCVEKGELISVQQFASSICDAQECRRRLSQACTRGLECGHHCGGLRGERLCLPCLEDGCRETVVSCKGHLLPSADDWCSICMVEPLRCAPSIQLKCGHIVHFNCAKKKLKEGFPGPEVSFGYLNCPQCSELMQHISLMHDMQKPLELLNLVKEKALNRLKMENLQPSLKLEELEAYALRMYQYYICCECKNPYFGGNRNCAADLGLQNNGNENLHNPLELVCGGCSAAVGAHSTCKKGHGKEYVEFKCRYCCSVATFFCFGRIHFCSSCHQTRPDLKQDFIPKQCKGLRSCPLNVVHAPNGEEYCLGCSMCRLLSQ